MKWAMRILYTQSDESEIDEVKRSGSEVQEHKKYIKRVLRNIWQNEAHRK